MLEQTCFVRYVANTVDNSPNSRFYSLYSSFSWLVLNQQSNYPLLKLEFHFLCFCACSRSKMFVIFFDMDNMQLNILEYFGDFIIFIMFMIFTRLCADCNSTLCVITDIIRMFNNLFKWECAILTQIIHHIS